MVITRYYLSIKAEKVAFRISLNDVPIASDDHGRGFNADKPLNAWIHPTSNELRVDVLWPEEIPFQPGEGKLSFQLFIHDNVSESPRPAQVLASFSWPLEDVPEGYPFTKRIPLPGEFPLPTLVWGEAEKLTGLAQGDKNAIIRLLEDYRKSLLGKDASAVYRFTKYKSQELARADFHTDMTEIEAIDLGQINWMLGFQEEIEVPRLPASDRMEFDLVAHNQLVHVYRRGGGPALQIIGDLADFGFDVYVARVEGEWRVVR